MASDPPDPMSEAELRQSLRLAFAPLHKRAFGMAVGLASGLLVFVATAYSVVVLSGDTPLWLLGEYFNGYTVSWPGAFVGFFWGAVTGFVAGWFAAFCRNLAMAALLFVGRTRAELDATRDFLDHI